MNDNPWHVDDMARAQRERIQEEMREIRLLEAANRARRPARSLLAKMFEQALQAGAALLRAAMKLGKHAQPQPVGGLHAKRSARA